MSERARSRYTECIAHFATLDSIALASASPRRRELLASLGLDVRVVPSAYIETALEGLDPAELALRHARGKAAGAAPADRLIVAADTVVDVDGEALGKPVDRAEARAMLRRLANRWHAVHTAFALRDDRTGTTVWETVTTRVRFADLDDDTIAAYAESGDGLDKAGAYGIQGFAATLVDRIDGDYFTVVGFPLAAFAQTLPRLGYQLRPTASAAFANAGRVTDRAQNHRADAEPQLARSGGGPHAERGGRGAWGGAP